jgi:serine/threonine protein kinase
MNIALTYLPKKYKAVPFTHHERMDGGRITNIDTFYACCSENIITDAEWIINKSIQSLDETSYGFAIVGLSELLQTPVIVKIMLNDPQGRREVKTQRFFKVHPHRNIVQGICEFKCLDSPIRWKVDLKRPKKLCHPRKQSESKEFIIIIQEYIQKGDLESGYKEWNYGQWKSLFLQTLFAIFELFEQYGFTYGDWKLRNILLDETIDKRVVYNAFGKEWIVENTYGLSPVFTDFSLCEFEENKKSRYLAYQISFCIDMYGRACPDKKIEDECMKFAMEIEEVTKLSVILEMVKVFIEKLVMI